MSIIDQMTFYALDSAFNTIAIVESHESLIWTERFSVPGDFEIFGPSNAQLRQIADSAEYIFNSATSRLMVIEDIEYEYSEEDGETIRLAGRSFESILDRRVVLSAITFLSQVDKRFSAFICDLINTAFGPTSAERYWDKLVVVNDTDVNLSPKLDGGGLEVNIGKGLLEIVTELSQAFDLGIKCELSLSDLTVTLTVYEGADHTAQGPNLVMFSDLYDTLSTARERIYKVQSKTAVRVIGKWEDSNGLPRYPTTVEDSTGATGLSRREMFFEADQDEYNHKADGTNVLMNSTLYTSVLKEHGKKELGKPENHIIREYEGGINETADLRYGTTYSLGDLVSFLMPHSLTPVKVRVTGVTFSDDSNEGKRVSPIFEYVA